MIRSRKNGFSVVEVIIAILIIALIGFILLKAWEVFSSDDAQLQSDTSQQPTSQQAPAINSAEDLTEAEKMLDETNVEGSSEQELDSETGF
ncbi:MAG TPA: prepilin-type N-terminal cleavage/methylation domain-containing protein [Candidatus Nitrosotenuis sp.]|nr:prepilin-type N-terminal cleavage/methylation domain-containing protein [Candidatus Nitrosotenuis sp.]